METVWIIEQGSYSDYTMVGIFSTKAHAEAVCAYINSTDQDERATVDERMVDPGVEELRQGLLLFNVTMMRDGTSENIHVSTCVEGMHNMEYLWGSPGKKKLHAYVWAHDPQHAVKIVNEKRIQMIANNQWEVT